MARLEFQHEFVWDILQEYVPEGTKLSSVLRSDQEQLNTIVRYAKAKNYKFKTAPTLASRGSWYPALAHIRSKGIIIAEPGKSPHQHGLAFDLVGPDLEAISKAVEQARDDGAISIKRKIIERGNKCVHVEVSSAQKGNSIVFLEGATIIGKAK